MKTNPCATIRAFWLSIALLCFSLPLRADHFGVFTYQVVGGATVEITAYLCNATGAVVIPGVIEGKPVTRIGDWAFWGCTGLTSVTIPSSVTSIGSYSFAYCGGLTSVNIPSSVTRIGDIAFYRCTGLQSINVDAENPNFTSSGGVLFDKAQTVLIRYPAGKAGAYTIPSSVTSIGESFSACTRLTSVTIPSSVTSVGREAFVGCSSLTSVTIPFSVTRIGDYAFLSCSSLDQHHHPLQRHQHRLRSVLELHWAPSHRYRAG